VNILLSLLVVMRPKIAAKERVNWWNLTLCGFSIQEGFAIQASK